MRKDPNTAGTEADIETLGCVVDDGPVRKAADDLNKACIELEMTLIDLRITASPSRRPPPSG